MENNKKVLLTGVTGFLGSHTTIQLLDKGYHVTGTLRNMKRANEIRAIIAQHTPHADRLSFAEADLKDLQIWNTLAKGMDYIQHIASPFPRNLPKSDAELVEPAKNGTLAILEAANNNDVKRVVITSSSGAITYGKPKGKRNATFTASDWTDETNIKDSTPYFRSKTIAEKAAWDYAKKPNTKVEVTTVCPGAILGPVLEKDFGTSANIVIKTIDGSTPGLPDIGFEIVDVRSVADLLILAMEKSQAANQRYSGTTGYLTFKNVADILRAEYPNRKIPKRVLPNFAVRLFSNIDKSVKPILIDLGIHRKIDSSRTRRELGWEPIDNKEAVLACAKSALELGIVK